EPEHENENDREDCADWERLAARRARHGAASTRAHSVESTRVTIPTKKAAATPTSSRMSDVQISARGKSRRIIDTPRRKARARSTRVAWRHRVPWRREIGAGHPREK